MCYLPANAVNIRALVPCGAEARRGRPASAPGTRVARPGPGMVDRGLPSGGARTEPFPYFLSLRACFVWPCSFAIHSSFAPAAPGAARAPESLFGAAAESCTVAFLPPCDTMARPDVPAVSMGFWSSSWT